MIVTKLKHRTHSFFFSTDHRLKMDIGRKFGPNELKNDKDPQCSIREVMRWSQSTLCDQVCKNYAQNLVGTSRKKDRRVNVQNVLGASTILYDLQHVILSDTMVYVVCYTSVRITSPHRVLQLLRTYYNVRTSTQLLVLAYFKFPVVK